MHSEYDKAIQRAEARFAPLTQALTRDLGLDVEPVVAQTGGMVMCLAIYWPDGAYVWISDYWWWHDDLVVGLYDSGDDDEGAYPEPPADLLAALCCDSSCLIHPDGNADEPWPGSHPTQAIIDRIAAWAAPIIRAHGAAHGWASRFEKEASHGA